MSDSQTFGFAKLVPGFDFLQNLAKGAGGGLPQMTQLSSWIAPTLNVEELDKRIQELRAVHFWLEQNGKALSATIQALEVQKMTLSTLQGMNLSMNELAESLQVKPGAMASAFAPPASAFSPGTSSGTSSGSPSAAESPSAASRPRKAAKPSGSTKAAGKSNQAAQGPAGAGAAAVDPLQWWGALSNQFQQIAAATLKDVAQAGAPAASAPAAASGAAGTPGRRPASAAKSTAAKSTAAKSTKGTRAARSPAKPRSRAAPPT
jgi:hypothetical protein